MASLTSLQESDYFPFCSLPWGFALQPPSPNGTALPPDVLKLFAESPYFQQSTPENPIHYHSYSPQDQTHRDFGAPWYLVYKFGRQTSPDFPAVFSINNPPYGNTALCLWQIYYIVGNQQAIDDASSSINTPNQPAIGLFPPGGIVPLPLVQNVLQAKVKQGAHVLSQVITSLLALNDLDVLYKQSLVNIQAVFDRHQQNNLMLSQSTNNINNNNNNITQQDKRFRSNNEQANAIMDSTLAEFDFDNDILL